MTVRPGIEGSSRHALTAVTESHDSTNPTNGEIKMENTCNCDELAKGIHLDDLDADTLSLLGEHLQNFLDELTAMDTAETGALHELVLHVPLGALQVAVEGAA